MADEKTVKVGLGLYLFNDAGQLLLGLRKSKHGQGTWCPPGGAMEYGESPKSGAAREAFEETGLIIQPQDIKILDVTNDFFEESGKHYITIQMSATKYQGEPKVTEPDKCEKWQWFPQDNLPKNMFLSAANFLKKHKLSEY